MFSPVEISPELWGKTISTVEDVQYCGIGRYHQNYGEIPTVHWRVLNTVRDIISTVEDIQDIL